MKFRPVVLALLLPVSAAADAGFDDEVWPEIAAQECLKCHKPGGDAEESELILADPSKVTGTARDDAMRRNRAAFAKMARAVEGDQSRLLLKVQGKLKHGGKKIFAPESAGFRILADFVKAVTTPVAAAKITPGKNAPPFFQGVAMLDERRLLRRATLSLAGRLPSDAELERAHCGGLKALPVVLDAVMKEDAFFARLREGFNDIFLTEGIDGNPDASVLSYDHFNKTRLWYQKHDLSHVKDDKERRQAGYKLANDYRAALLEEPMRLIEHIVREDRPFTEIVTADYIMVSPYTARGYGIYEEVESQFKNKDDPFEFIPVKLEALKGRSKQQDQESATGLYPHAGLLSSFQYLARYPTTETNRNRLRSRVYYQHFLGVDVLELAARVTDAAAVTAKYKVPTMEASECVVCHTTLDPVASLFQDYWKFAAEGIYGRRKGGWFTDMFQAGFEGEDMPPQERWRSLQWLGERTAKDPRFAVAMVEHAYYILTGRKALLPPKDLDDPLHDARHRAWSEQRRMIEVIAERFAQSGFNFKSVLKDLIISDFYRADGIAAAVTDPKRLAELDDIGLTRMLSPEQVERKIAAVFTKGFGRLHRRDGGLGMLYGGIDSKEVTERAADPSGAMGSIMRTLSNDVACKNTALDFTRPAAGRLFFREVGPDTLPGSAEADARIKRTIARLHERVLGRADVPESEEVARTFLLFTGILANAAATRREPQESYYCRPDPERTQVADPHYTIRAWRAVMTYLLRRIEFLYE